MATLADLQAERERLRAAQAKGDFEAALSATVAAGELLAAGNGVRRVVLEALDALADRFVSAIAGERDETRVHYLLSEEAHGWLTRLGDAAIPAAAQHAELGERFRRGVKPRDLLTVSEWSDRHRELKSGTNAPGPWRTDFTPYLREIMDCLSEHSAVRQVTFIKSSGVGGTEAMFNWIGYLMHHLGNKDLLEYDATDSRATHSGAYKAHPRVISRSASGAWRKAVFRVADAKFGGRQNGDADFRFFNGGDDLLVRAVTVRRSAQNPPASR